MRGALAGVAIIRDQHALRAVVLERGPVYVVRAFVRLREVLAGNKALAKKLTELERKFETHDEAIAAILSAIRELMAPPQPPKKRGIGFITEEE